MKYVDFSSLVQLGVGLHIGTALLQLYPEFALQPLERAVGRIATLVNELGSEHPHSEDYEILKSDFSIFKIQLWNENKRLVIVNGSFAVILIGILILISFAADEPVPIWLSILIALLSVGPAGVSLLVLWKRSRLPIAKLRVRASNLEGECMRSIRMK